MASIEDLHNDIVMDILANLETEDLSSCLGVNKSFNNMIKDPIFKPTKTTTFSGYLIQTSSKYSFLADQGDRSFENGTSNHEIFDELNILSNRYTRVEAVSQCRGLICCLRDELSIRRFYVCKPATRQCRALPNPKLRFETAATAIVASVSGQQFKIVRFSLPRDGRSMYIRCEVFDSRTWKWKRCKDIKEDIKFLGNWRHDGAIFAQGSIHWLTQQGIFAFNMHRETWNLINLPFDFAEFESKQHEKITLRDRKLNLVHIDDDAKVVMWPMNNNVEERWGPRQLINFSKPIKEENWLHPFFDLFYSSTSCCSNCLFNNNWKEVWKVRLETMDANKFILGGDVFKYESDATPCRVLNLPEPLSLKRKRSEDDKTERSKNKRKKNIIYSGSACREDGYTDTEKDLL